MCICWYITGQNHFCFQATAFHGSKRKSRFKHFTDAQLRILWNHFQKNPYITYTEAEELAKMMDVYPQKILSWFQHRRTTGGLQQLEMATKG